MTEPVMESEVSDQQRLVAALETIADFMATQAEANELIGETLGGIFVQESRIYDVLMLLLTDEQRDKLADLHAAGGILSAPPVLTQGAFDE